MGDITELLKDAALGDAESKERLFSIVYRELQDLARRKLAGEAMPQTLQTTDLVHEAYVRLGGTEQSWGGRKHFFAAAAEAMRRILVERARARKRLKRGGNRRRRDFHEDLVQNEPPSDEVLDVHASLDLLAEKYPRKAELVKLRFFAGLTNREAAEALDITTRTAERHWAFARAWLLKELKLRDDRTDSAG